MGDSPARAALTVAVAQPPLISHDVAANATAHAVAVRSAGARLVVFPELSLTGYELAAPVVAADDPRLAPVVAACADTASVALVGAPVAGSGGRPHIGVLAVDGTGVTVAYRKLYLGTEEAVRFAPGAGPVVIEIDGWRLGLAVCKDTGVAEHAVRTAALGMDAYVAGTAKRADEAALQAERAHRVAVEHRVWVAVSSFAGSTGGGFAPAAGRSGIWAPDGALLAQAGPEPGDAARATIG